MTRINRHLALSTFVLVPLLAVGGAVHVASPALAKPGKVPDLKVSAVTVKAGEVKPGDKLAITATVANGGKAKAKRSKVRFFLSTDKTRGADLAVAATARVSPLAPGRKVVTKANIVVPASAEDGAYYVLACADAAGKDARKGNDCRPTKGRATVRAPWKGILTGALTFDKGYTKSSTGSTETSIDHATVQVQITVDETKPWPSTFANAGSTYGYTGTYHRLDTSNSCVVEAKGKSDGGGALIQRGNQYEDDILGSFGSTDHSEFDLLIDLDYQTIRTTTYSTVGETGCIPETKVDGPRASGSRNEIEFHEVARTARSVTYDVAEVLGPLSTKTDWTTVSGKLTLSRR